MLALILTLLAPVPPDSTANDKYESAVIAAIHAFTRDNEPDHLDALLEKHPKLVDALRRFPNPTKPSYTDAFTPLHWAARDGHEKTANVLLNHKANVSADSGHGWTAMHLAAQSGHLDLVKLLVERGAKIDAKTEAQPEREFYAPSTDAATEQKPIKLEATPAETPLDVAIRFKKEKVAQYLKSVKK